MATLAEEVQKRMIATLAPYMGKVSFGNLRFQVSEWAEGEDKYVNIAVVYETPGSSTNQLNITVDERRKILTFIDGETERQTSDINEAIQFLEEAVRSIPERRLERLRERVRRWMGQGRSRAEVLAELNRLLRADLIGGTITHHELKATIQYCLQLFNVLPSEERAGSL